MTTPCSTAYPNATYASDHSAILCRLIRAQSADEVAVCGIDDVPGEFELESAVALRPLPIGGVGVDCPVPGSDTLPCPRLLDDQCGFSIAQGEKRGLKPLK